MTAFKALQESIEYDTWSFNIDHYDSDLWIINDNCWPFVPECTTFLYIWSIALENGVQINNTSLQWRHKSKW